MIDRSSRSVRLVGKLTVYVEGVESTIYCDQERETFELGKA